MSTDKSCYVVKIPLRNEPWANEKLTKLFNNAHNIYNASVAEVKRRLNILEHDEEYITILNNIRSIYEEKLDIAEEKTKLGPYFKKLKEKRCLMSLDSDYSLVTIVRSIVNANAGYSNISSTFISSISSDIWRALEKYFFGNGRKISYKSRKKDTTVTKLAGTRVRPSLNSKSKSTRNAFNGLKFGFNVNKELCLIHAYQVKINGKKVNKNIFYPLQLDVDNTYLMKNLAYAFEIDFIPKTKKELMYFINTVYNKMLENNWKELTFLNIGNCSLIREFIRGSWRYFLNLTIYGEPLNKYTETNDSEIATNIVGIDMGTQTCSLCYRHVNGEVFRVEMFELSPEIDNDYMGKLASINFDMERKRKLNNKANFNSDGTISKGKYNWMESQNYNDIRNSYKKLNRNKTIYTKISHSLLVKHILSYAHNVSIEPFNTESLAKRAKETTYRTVKIDGEETQRANSKKRFGKSVNKKSPALFLNILKKAVEEVGGEYHEINHWEVKASQYNHQLDEYTKKYLSERWNYGLLYMGDNIEIQRDLYSAFLISNVIEDTTSNKANKLVKIDKELCERGFDSFVALHNLCVTEAKELNSTAINTILKKDKKKVDILD